jgi:hypothetical protein
MICKSIVAPRQWVHGGGPHGMGIPVAYVPYPDAVDGIVAEADRKGNFFVWVGDKRVPVSPELVAAGAASVTIENEYRLRILHASLSRDANGHVLVPSKDDSHGMLVLCDPSHGREGTVRLVTAGGAKKLVAGQQHHELFVGCEEVALLQMPAGSSVSAIRESKRWIWFGASSVRESLRYRVDGPTVWKMITFGGADTNQAL